MVARKVAFGFKKVNVTVLVGLSGSYYEQNIIFPKLKSASIFKEQVETTAERCILPQGHKTVNQANTAGHAQFCIPGEL